MTNPNSFVFIIIRHVDSEVTNEYWQQNYKCIRKSYPTIPIVIIDDNSNLEYVYSDVSMENITIISSEFPKGRGEILGYYYFFKERWADYCMIIHDSFWIQSPIPELETCIQNPDFTVRFLCDFNMTQGHHNFQDEINMINKLKNPGEFVAYFHQLDICRTGCFGLQSLISFSFLNKIQETFNFMLLMEYITSRNDRMLLERVFGGICCFIDNHFQENTSFYGNILDNYIRRYEQTSYSHFIENQEKIGEQHRQFIKIFSGR